MPIIIWGSRSLKSTVESGQFYCPRCEDHRDYRLHQVRPFFTLYFIPLFPIGGRQRYVECLDCAGTYKEEVLSLEPPGDEDRFLASLYEDLQRGTSLEETEQLLARSGMDRGRAAAIVQKMAEDPWRCELCGDHYTSVVRKCPRCKG